MLANEGTDEIQYQIEIWIWDTIQIWKNQIKPKWTNIQELDIETLFQGLATLEIWFTDILVRLKNLPKDAPIENLRTALEEITIYEMRHPALNDFARGILLATWDYVLVANLVWLHLDKNEIYQELRRRARELKITRAIWKCFKDKNIRGLLGLMGNAIKKWWKNMGILPNRAMRSWTYDLHKLSGYGFPKGFYTPKTNEIRDCDKEFDEEGNPKEISCDTKADWKTENEDEIKNFTNKRNWKYREELWLKKVHGEETLAYIDGCFIEWYRTILLQLAHWLRFKSPPFSIASRRKKAPKAWKKLAPEYFKSLVSHLFLMVPYFDGSVEKLPLKIHDRKKIFVKGELRTQKRADIRGDGREVLSLDQCEGENQEGETTNYRDALELSAQQTIKDMGPRDEEVERASIQIEQKRKRLYEIAKNHTSNRKFQNQYKKAIDYRIANYLITGKIDVDGECKAGGIHPRTWYAFRQKYSLDEKDELPPKKNESN